MNGCDWFTVENNSWRSRSNSESITVKMFWLKVFVIISISCAVNSKNVCETKISSIDELKQLIRCAVSGNEPNILTIWTQRIKPFSTRTVSANYVCQLPVNINLMDPDFDDISCLATKFTDTVLGILQLICSSITEILFSNASTTISPTNTNTNINTNQIPTSSGQSNICICPQPEPATCNCNCNCPSPPAGLCNCNCNCPIPEKPVCNCFCPKQEQAVCNCNCNSKSCDYNPYTANQVQPYTYTGNFFNSNTIQYCSLISSFF